MAKQKITDLVAELLTDFLADNGYELYSSEFVKEGRDWFLRVYVDKVPADLPGEDGAGQPAEEQYISTEDCEKVSRFLSEKLDETDPIAQNYYLEVSSPGMDRTLFRPEHYRRFAGRPVEVKLYRAMEGNKQIDGILEGISGETIVVTEENGRRWELPLEQVARTKLAVIF